MYYVLLSAYTLIVQLFLLAGQMFQAFRVPDLQFLYLMRA